MDAGLVLVAEAYDSPSAELLTQLVQQEYVERYGAPDDAPLGPAELAPPRGRFLVGYLNGVPVAMGGLRPAGPSTLELKRMYVHPGQRGRGLSRQLLAALEQEAVAMGAEQLVLETGQRQPEALALYRSSGYRDIPSFGHYADSPLSVSLGKDLPAVSG